MRALRRHGPYRLSLCGERQRDADIGAAEKPNRILDVANVFRLQTDIAVDRMTVDRSLEPIVQDIGFDRALIARRISRPIAESLIARENGLIRYRRHLAGRGKCPDLNRMTHAGAGAIA